MKQSEAQQLLSLMAAKTSELLFARRNYLVGSTTYR